ncbi:DNA-binding protein RHL1 [Carex littledalei]|uniref:DNA-binding protein RHL1 n=1 Tax=Carex littledalei TaxID=544730 RepID=A0A833RZU2_9POAL|nr:DNA-binding protein RHL1 [Carex littledalei]
MKSDSCIPCLFGFSQKGSELTAPFPFQFSPPQLFRISNKMVKKSKNSTQPDDPEAEEKKRLRSLALSKRLLRRGAPAEAAAPLRPAKSVVKLDGRDVVKRGQRKSRFLFSLPGLLAPLSGGRIGELACLASKNPILYLEFPQGRMKLFGTHVYPKNKYLTLQLTRSSKGVMCEDIFESLIVFSEAWWIGTKEENPDELRLEFPKNLQDGKQEIECDFKGGAGASEEATNDNKLGKDYVEPISPDLDIDKDNNDSAEGSERKMETDRKSVTTETPGRQSSRVSRKSLTYAESSPSDASADTDDDDKQTLAAVLGSKNEGSSKSEQSASTRKSERSTPRKNKSKVIEVEEISSESEELKDDSDEDWAV